MSIRDECTVIDSTFQQCLYTSSLAAVRKAFFELDATRKKAVLNRCGRMLKSDSLACVGYEAIRVSTMKLVIAAFPDSSKIIDHLLRRRYAGRQSEILFTFFCFADGLLSVKGSEVFCQRILSFTRDFLLNVRNDAYHTAWMAGDLLGAHWRLQSALPVLMGLSQSGRYAAGRESAVDGLAKAFERTQNARTKRELLKLVQDIHAKDKSRKVRLSAQLFLQHCPTP